MFRLDSVEIFIFGPILVLRSLTDRLEGRNVYLHVSLPFRLHLLGVSLMFRADPVETSIFRPIFALHSRNARPQSRNMCM